MREAAMQTKTDKPPGATTFERSYPGIISQARLVRADLRQVARECPVLEEVLLLESELVTNAILHSRSGRPCHGFAVHAMLYPGDYAWVEITDQGGAWIIDEHDDEHGRGLAIVAAVAGPGNWGINGDAASRAAWFRLSWIR
jgi:anti-sigma regulatory factor (Ser/Thr protein kinase)